MRIRMSIVAASFFIAMAAFAQPSVRLPELSPAANVGQTIGVTDIAITYHRPSVKGRSIFGGLVPYGVVWRCGANESTLVSFSTPVSVEGQPLPAGTYSLFMIPGEQQWTVIFNKFTGGWGTYSYDASEDALRVTVVPKPAEMQEGLIYTFDDPTPSAVTASLRWDKLRVPVKITADTPKLTLASIRGELRGGKHWSAEAWNTAASYALRNGDTESALAFLDKSFDLGTTGGALRIKAVILEKKGDAKGAAELRAEAGRLSPEAYALNQAYTLAGAKKYPEAIKAVNAYIASHPQSWRAYAALGDFYGHSGDQAKAKEQFDRAMSLASDTAQRVEVQDSINSLGAEMK